MLEFPKANGNEDKEWLMFPRITRVLNEFYFLCLGLSFFKKMAKQKDLPRWITGDLANTDQNDYFVSEDESEKRIFIAVQIFITFLLVACCILVEKCFSNSSFSVKRIIIHSSNGK